MKRLHIAALAALAGIALAQAGWTQTALRVDGQVEYLALDYATGEITTLDPAADALVPACYDNGISLYTGMYAPVPVGEEHVDWGTKACGLTGYVCRLMFGYATTAMDPIAGGPGASLTVSIYSGYTGSCSGGGATPAPVATYSFTGLPGNVDGVTVAAFNVTVDVASKGFQLVDGPIAWSYGGSDGVSGPLLMSTAGTCGGPGDPATGTEDCYDVHTGGTCSGTFSFGTPGVSSFYLQIGEDDGSTGGGSQAQRFGLGCNTGVLDLGTEPPRIGSMWDPSISADAVLLPTVDFFAISTGPGGDGCILLIDTAGVNPLVTGGGPLGFGAPFGIPVPPNCALIGATASIQGGQIGEGFGFTNAIDFTIGV